MEDLNKEVIDDSLPDDVFPGWGFDNDTIERMGYRVRGRHKGIVYPMPSPLSDSRYVSENFHIEPGFSLDVPKDRREKFILLTFPIKECTKYLEERFNEIKKENEDNKFVFYDENGDRCLNTIDEYYYSYKSYFKYFMNEVLEYYSKNNKSRFGKILNSSDIDLNITNRDKSILFCIFAMESSLIVLRNNHYDFFKENSKYRNKDEEEYCKMVTSILTEIMINSYNYYKYVINPNDSEKVKELLAKIEENYQSHIAKANTQNILVKKMLRA